MERMKRGGVSSNYQSIVIGKNTGSLPIRSRSFLKRPGRGSEIPSAQASQPQIYEEETDMELFEPMKCAVKFHEPRASTAPVLLEGKAALGIKPGTIGELESLEGTPRRLMFLVKYVEDEIPSSKVNTSNNPNQPQVSIQTGSLQELLMLKRGSPVLLRLRKRKDAEADVVELRIKDVHLSRGDMWCLSSTLAGTCVYKHEKKSFIDSSIRTTVSKIYVGGRSVFSAYVGKNTRIIFRSESVKLVILIQISSEMWDFEETGQQMFNKLINSLFPKIFSKWTELGAHHLITIVLFSSIDLGNKSWSLLGSGDRPPDRKDYYRVVVDQVSILLWSEIMSALRFEFANFMKDIMLRENKAPCKTDRNEEYVIQGRFLPAVKGNLIEAINLATTLVTDHFRDPELRYTSNHFILISPGTGIYDVDYNLMAHTSKKMAKVDAAIDVICLSQPPLHVVPLFRYKESNSKIRHCIPTWLDVSFWNDSSQYISQWMPRCKIYEIQMMGVVENELKTINLPNLRINPNSKSINEVIDKYDEDVFKPVSPHTSEEKKIPLHLSPEVLQVPKKNSPSTETFKIKQTKECQPSTIDVKALGTTNSRLGISARSSLLNFINDDSKSGIGNFIRERISSLPASLVRVKSAEFDKEEAKTQTVRPVSMFPMKEDTTKSKNIQPPRRLEKVVKKVESTTQSPPSLTRTNSSVSVPEDVNSQRDDKLSPYWTTVQNPSKALTSELLKMIGYGRWQHVFPSKVKRRAVKWSSLSTPASLPLTTQVFPRLSDFESNFTFQIYDVILNNNDTKINTGDLIREMIYLRLVLGFQICTGEKVDTVESRRKPGGDPNLLIKYLDKHSYHGSRIYMILEDEIHRISCDYHGKANVQLYRRSTKSINVKAEDVGSYFSNIRTRYDDLYRPSVVDCFKNEIKSYNWNQLDQILAGYYESVDEDQKYYHKMKFVILPADIPEKSYAFKLNENKEKLSPEELRLEGLRKLIATIHKGRHVAEQDKTKQAKKEEILPEINFYTGDLFTFLSKQSEVYDPDKPHKNTMLVESLGLNTNISMKQLAHYLQSKDGIVLADRKWHFRIHRHCFVGLELVSWMIENFNDIDSREEAERYGNKLMNNGLFSHVEKRHSFLDGHYFYRLNSEYVEKVEPGNTSVKTRESRSNSITDSSKLKSPMLSPQTTRERSGTITDSPLKKVTSKTTDGAPKRFMLSRFVIYDVDQQKKSYRRELVKVHYDRVHNPEHCFHIRLEWLNTTAKLIEDTVNSWTRLCERYGLKFVETPWAELCSMPEKNPFHSFVTIRLALNPWNEKEFTPEDNNPLDENKFFYHLYLLDKSGFMLDNRTTIFFTKVEINVAYSWGTPEFKFAQFIHKTGAYIAEIRDNGDLFLAPNNTHVARVNMDISNNNIYQQQSNYGTYLDSQRVMLEFQSTCGDAEKLRKLFNEARVKWEKSRDIDQAIFGS
ncbi:hypothetical protein LJB42_000567 [Komagataella kurtzmanii]|nr:hypothetical protein LJB42_000567 [Komagataella kurtzmanii]